MIALCVACLLSQCGLSFGGFSFFVYPWEEDLVLGWPSAFTHKKRLSFSPSNVMNSGLGAISDGMWGLFQTHQYSVFEIFYRRLLESPLRTTDPDKADMFFIPYDLGMDATTRREDGGLVQTNCPKVSKVLSLLESSRHFASHAAQHFLLTSINQPMNYYLTPQCNRLYELCFNCTKLCIDVYPPRMFREIMRSPARMHKWYSIPFPSNFHTGPQVKRLPWRKEHERPGQRQHLITFMGTTQITATRPKLLREAIIEQCALLTDSECFIARLSTHLSTVSLRPVYARSRLCLMPGGDFPTRKAVLDALFVGCVPVLFQKSSAHTQWLWHWGGQNVVNNATVFMHMEYFVHHPTAAMNELLDVARDEAAVSRMRAAFDILAFRMQYSQLGVVNGPKDAVDVVLDHFAAHI